jgi:hypothetical protein
VAGYLIVLAVLAVTIALISGPLRVARHAPSDTGDVLAELEAARDAKYQELRDTEMDLRTGKLSDEDHQAIEATLRAEAIEILHRLDEAEADAESARVTDATASDAAPSRISSSP